MSLLRASSPFSQISSNTLEVIGSEVGACVAAHCKTMYPESSLLSSTTGPCIKHFCFGSIGGGAKQLSLSTPHRRAKKKIVNTNPIITLSGVCFSATLFSSYPENNKGASFSLKVSKFSRALKRSGLGRNMGKTWNQLNVAYPPKLVQCILFTTKPY
ncbi:Uncharacterized protein HZ326_25137 [Fusarium oxysporum f. sp. albedinis]|nr:Uncharacterized protein HZ326_25137 [Fusarium oxysporum f. sp. albedinis]